MSAPDETSADGGDAASAAIGGAAAPDGPLLRLIKDRRVAFLIVGAVNTGVGFVWFTLFSLLFRHWWPDEHATVFAVILCAHIMSTLSAFVFYRKLVFRVRGHLWLDFWRFQLVYLGAFLLNILIVPLLKLWMDEILAQLLFTVVTVFISWFGHSRFSFRRKENT
ncbi:GtrA family protein [Microbacterium marinilacus]|uniref:GtrA/DPMS transmembrane domain-containing protein n=1 Tax=Microbacterium marinilacus TaxID=415209 RepID=A0ABP7B8Z6_9MICO|nr:GtrA family protein [Microbacterium marinilacus]MBY0687196.1 GtrA family protein [Microbacterium marinilacus]